MDRDILSRRGAGLWELALVSLLAGVFIWAVVGHGGRAAVRARQERTALELDALSRAAILYRAWHGCWPGDIDQMLEMCAAGCPRQDGWGDPYRLSATDEAITVWATVPGVWSGAASAVPMLMCVGDGEGTRMEVTRVWSEGRLRSVRDRREHE